MKKRNKNDTPLDDIHALESEIDYTDFLYREHFTHLCNLEPQEERESLIIKSVNRENIDNQGLVYALVVGDKILKIGHTITDIKKRVQAYNCGKREYRKSGTCSTTNFFILQTILNIGSIAEVYAYFPQRQAYKFLVKVAMKRFPPQKS